MKPTFTSRQRANKSLEQHIDHPKHFWRAFVVFNSSCVVGGIQTETAVREKGLFHFHSSSGPGGKLPLPPQLLLSSRQEVAPQDKLGASGEGILIVMTTQGGKGKTHTYTLPAAFLIQINPIYSFLLFKSRNVDVSCFVKTRAVKKGRNQIQPEVNGT